MNNCKAFFDSYSASIGVNDVVVVEIGSQDVNGSLRSVCPESYKYIGVDFCEAKGVDIVLTDPYSLPFENESVDVFVSSSCFEHSEFFWLVFLEVMRCLKPQGLFYLNAPSSGSFHRYPVDCWRFYPDSGRALVNWAKRNGINACELESYTQLSGSWQDYVAVFLKDEVRSESHPGRILHHKTDFENGQIFRRDEIFNLATQTQNERKLNAIVGILNETLIVK